MGLGSAGATERGERARTREFFFFCPFGAARKKVQRNISPGSLFVILCSKGIERVKRGAGMDQEVRNNGGQVEIVILL